jgi:hypothetical protein
LHNAAWVALQQTRNLNRDGAAAKTKALAVAATKKQKK